MGVERSCFNGCYEWCVWWIGVGEDGMVVLAREPTTPGNSPFQTPHTVGVEVSRTVVVIKVVSGGLVLVKVE